MERKVVIDTELAPKAIGTYSQAIKTFGTVYLSGQIPLEPESMQLVKGPVDKHVHQVFLNLRAVCQASGGSLHDLVKLNVFLCDLQHFEIVNEVMAEYFKEPYPARAAIQVSALPRGAIVEMDGIMII